MAKLTRVEVDCATGEQTVVELTAAEIAELDQMKAQAEADQAARQAEEDAAKAASEAAKASAQAKLAALGLTQEEITALTK